MTVPPGSIGQPPPAAQKSNTVRLVLIIVGAVALVCCVGLAAGGFWLFSVAKNTVGPARDQAVAFVQDLEAQNATAAYDRLCASTRAKFSRPDLIRVMAAHSRIAEHKVTGFNVSGGDGETSADIMMQLTDDTGTTVKHTFHMVKQGGTWYVCGEPY